MSDSYLDKVYTAKTPDETREVYDAWAKSYEAEIAQNGYATPRRCAAALQAYSRDPAAPILDFGCGTGLSGIALRAAGFTTLDGMDLSAGMLEEARAKDVYRNLEVIDAEAAVPKGYAAIAAIGVIGAGAAPLAVLDKIVAALAPGGMTVFSFNDHTLADPSYEARLNALVARSVLIERFREHGDHLPGRDMKSTVYVYEKL